MNLLLDSQVVLWGLIQPSRISKSAATAILNPANTVFVSALTPYELGWKHTIGKLALPPIADWSQTFAAAGYAELAITVAHTQHAARMPALHRDPWDRLLLAQAAVEALTLVSSDRMIRRYGVPILW